MVTFDADIDDGDYELIQQYANLHGLTFSEAVSRLVRQVAETSPELFAGYVPQSSNRVKE